MKKIMHSGVCMAALCVGAMLTQAASQQLHQVPFDQALSVYVGHYGTWINYNAEELEEAEIEDHLSLFAPEESVEDDWEFWTDHQVNDPQPPPGWFFFEPAEDESMELHVVVEDDNGRLNQVIVTNYDTGEQLGTLDASADGSVIDGTLIVEPEIETLLLDVRGGENNGTLARMGALTAKVAYVVVFSHDYQFQPNRGDEHDCLLVPPNGPPYGDPNSLQEKGGHKKRTTRLVETRACNGPVEYENDANRVLHIRGKYDLLTKRKLEDTTENWSPPNMKAEAQQKIMDAISQVRSKWAGGTGVVQEFIAPPYSKGTVHFPVGVRGGATPVLYLPFKSGHRWTRAIEIMVGAIIPWAAGIGTDSPLRAVINAFVPTPDIQKRLAGPMPVGEVWGLEAWAHGSADGAIENITAPVTIELWGDKVWPDGQEGLLGGTGQASVDTAYTTPPPPPPEFSPLDLEFPMEGENKGRCTVELGKGWKWKANGHPTIEGYGTGQVGSFQVPVPGPVKITCPLITLLVFKVKTVDSQGHPVQASIEMEQFQNGQWVQVATGESQIDPATGEAIWVHPGPVSPGQYRVRAQAMGPWSDWLSVGVNIGMEKVVQITTPPPGEPGGGEGGGGGGGEGGGQGGGEGEGEG